ncbi:uncharacterized protein [Antedon mediterranea]|uniref:uncharacterized protein n=1 Tax=Antedon mediterranea TaxID=105859 RepID=UPI003AF77966
MQTGLEIKHRQSFTSPDDPCVRCMCKNGRLNCKRRDCLILHCNVQVKEKGECCPKCAEKVIKPNVNDTSETSIRVELTLPPPPVIPPPPPSLGEFIITELPPTVHKSAIGAVSTPDLQIIQLPPPPITPPPPPSLVTSMLSIYGVNYVPQATESTEQSITEVVKEEIHECNIIKQSCVGPGPEREPGEYGQPGPAGPIGKKGPPGRRGKRGDDGPPGKRGKSGERGKPGLPGKAGPPGEPGKDGIPGLPGIQSATGPVGPMGERGPRGKTGKRGLIGPPGITGSKGNMGIQGPRGIDGPPGYKGDRGMMGIPGAPGLTGRNGPPGPNGVDGIKGEKGDTVTNGQLVVVADEFALNEINSEVLLAYRLDNKKLYLREDDQWQCVMLQKDIQKMQGPPGPPGETGKRGKPGPMGPRGEKGDGSKVVKHDDRQSGNCGNGIIENGESCDDANNNDNDNCINCNLSFCGDGYRQEGVEECDTFDFGDKTCDSFLPGYVATGRLRCNFGCQINSQGCRALYRKTSTPFG